MNKLALTQFSRPAMINSPTVSTRPSPCITPS